MKSVIDGEFLSLLEGHDISVYPALSGAFGGNRKAMSYGSSCEFAEYRDYTEGDDLRYIDWNLFARFGKLFLKLYVDERQLHHRIYIDGSASMDWGDLKKSHTAMKLCCAIAYLSSMQSDRISVEIMHGGKLSEVCRPFTGRDAFYDAAEKIGRMEFYGESDIESAIGSDEKVGYGDGISFIISDLLTDSDWKNAIDRLLYRKRDVCLIQVLSRDEISPSLRGKLLMIDSESLSLEDAKNYRSDVTRSSIKAYEQAFLWHQKDIRDFCSSRKIRFIQVCSDDPIEKILFEKATSEGLIK